MIRALEDGGAARRVMELYDERRRDRGRVLEQMRAVAEVYNGDVVLPLPELNAEAKATVTNITQQGLDQMSMRIASVMPNLEVPSARPGFQRHDDAARDRRRAWLGMWANNDMELVLAQRARWLLGYAQSPVLIRPNLATRMVQWCPRSPMMTYPAPTSERLDMEPPDVIFATRMRWAELAKRYPAQAARIAHPPQGQFSGTDHDSMVDVLDYWDDEERITVAVGRAWGIYGLLDGSHFEVNTGRPEVLERVPNRCYRCPVVVPGRITLDRLLGQFDGVVGMHHTMTELMGLSLLATKKGILGEHWLVGRPNEIPEIVQAADPTAGEPGIVTGGTLDTVQQNPDYASYAAVDRLEQAARESAAVPGDLTGSPSYARTTGRRADQLLSATIDFPIQEAQKLIARSMRAENEIAALIDRNYFGGTRRTFHINWPKAKGHIDYKPADLWNTERNGPLVSFPSYALAGADSMMINVELAQRVGAGTLSPDTAMELDPLVDDVETERARIVSNRLQQAFLASIETQAADPQGPYQPADFASLLQKVSQGQDLPEAVLEVQREAQERQAEQTPDPAAAEPGLSPPGAGMEQELAQIGPPNRNQANLAQLLRSTTTTGYDVS
ncbi:MAG: hypothetical protein ACLFRV_03885 [Acidimicrobiales bacterium]